MNVPDYMKEFIVPDVGLYKAEQRALQHHRKWQATTDILKVALEKKPKKKLSNIKRKLAKLHKRHGHNRCFYCDEKPGNTVDHFVPKAKGGSNKLKNMVPSCSPCNLTKADRMPTMQEITKFKQQPTKETIMDNNYRRPAATKTAAQFKEENDRILAELKALPEGAEIERLAEEVSKTVMLVMRANKEKEDFLEQHSKHVAPLNAKITESEAKIKDLLIAVEQVSGYSKMQTSFGTYALMSVAENYQVKDASAVPADFLVEKVTISVDKKMLNDAIKTGVIDVDAASNWLELRPAYKTLVRK